MSIHHGMILLNSKNYSVNPASLDSNMKKLSVKRGTRIFLSMLLWASSQSLSAQEKVWTLKDCIEYAFKNNVALNQQKLISDISKVNYDQSKANRLPNLNFSDAQAFSFGNTIYGGGSQVIHQNTASNDPSLSSSVVLFSGFKYMNLVKENKLNYDASKLDVETQKNNLALNTTAAYVQVLFEYDAVIIATHQIDADSVQVKKAAKYVAVGQLAESSLFQIIAQLATDKAAKVNAENQLQLSKVQLMQLMEMSITPNFEIQRPELKEIPQDVGSSSAEIYKIAESTFPEVKSAAIKTNAAGIDLLVNKSALMPSLSLNGSLSTEYYSTLSRISYQTINKNETIGYLQSNPSENVIGQVPVTTTNTQHYPFFDQFKDNFSQLISFNLSVPIFNNYKARNNIRLSKIAVENARLNEQAVKNTLRKNVEQAYTDQLAAYKNFMATVEQLNSETRAYTDMEKKFNVGLASATDYLVEKNNYYKAILANLQAKYEYIFKTKVVDFYTGTPLTQ